MNHQATVDITVDAETAMDAVLTIYATCSSDITHVNKVVVQSQPADVTPWYSDHDKLAMTAAFMARQGHSMDDIIYMLEKPHKHGDDYNLAQAESELS